MIRLKKILVMSICLSIFINPILVKADELNIVEEQKVVEERKRERLEVEKEFDNAFQNKEIDEVEESGKITLDGDFSDWTNMPYFEDEDKYGNHSENILGYQYYIDKKDKENGKPYLYLRLDMDTMPVTHIRAWLVTNESTFNKFYENYNNRDKSTGCISTLENDKEGVKAYNINIEKLTSAEPYRVQVLNHNANLFKEQGYWVKEDSGSKYTAELRIPLEHVMGEDGGTNFNLVLGTDLYKYPTGDFIMTSITSGSTGPVFALGLGLVTVLGITIRKNKNSKEDI
ncbi:MULTISPECIES: hypothetical protein [Clostridium]|nr:MULTISPECIES: hypothetical protein [Clostridium]MDB2105156.1 hypothetical protein [Clostridium paraputrificum]MDB2112355.1 hypothetical protein [Clostridium paraputrificum]MDU5741212.1 hypothetical protein [Clostridium sp.]MDU5785344.1 hypothetical protein [Clostridium sp.]